MGSEMCIRDSPTPRPSNTAARPRRASRLDPPRARPPPSSTRGSSTPAAPLRSRPTTARSTRPRSPLRSPRSSPSATTASSTRPHHARAERPSPARTPIHALGPPDGPGGRSSRAPSDRPGGCAPDAPPIAPVRDDDGRAEHGPPERRRARSRSAAEHAERRKRACVVFIHDRAERHDAEHPLWRRSSTDPDRAAPPAAVSVDAHHRPPYSFPPRNRAICT